MLKPRTRPRDVKRPRRKAAAADLRPATDFETFLGWCVHAYTALGLVRPRHRCALRSGRPGGVSLVVPPDGARDPRRRDRRHAGPKVKVKEVVPGFDGRRLDDIIDFLTYTFFPFC